MADVDDTKEEEKQEKTDGKASGGGILPWIIVFVVVVLCGGAGFALGRLLVGFRAPKAHWVSEQYLSAQVEDLEAKGLAADSQKSWYYALEPVVANLDVADVTRYVQASLTLEVSSEVNKKKGTAFLNEKKPILINWLTVYLASLGLDDIRGDRNLKRIQSQVLDAFNETLFPDSKPKIKHILFKEFAVQ
jgi:flagellar basal body-associated protein FliL